MRKYIVALAGVLISALSSAQIVDPVKWTYSVKNTGDCEAELIFSATVDAGWHLYSQENPPNPLVFEFNKNASYKLSGKVKEPKPHKEDDEYLGPVAYFKTQKVEFRQKITLAGSKDFKLKGVLYGQACQDNGVCIPVESEFAFDIRLNGQNCAADPGDSDSDGIPDATDACPDDAGEPGSNGCPEKAVVDTVKKTANVPVTFGEGSGNCPVPAPEKLSDDVLSGLEAGCGDGVNEAADKSFWGIFIAGFLGGLLALLTPCVFPMIPLTVSFFTKQSKNRAKGVANAFIYALSIIVIYTGLGFIVTKAAGPDALNNMASSAFWNLLFFIVFIVFAASFMGAFEITLPSKFVNTIDKGSNKGGLIGIFFMAFTLSLVSFSCTGPIIGTLLVEAAVGGSNIGPLMGMFGFSLALALPFALFAAFPGWLNSLPKSGGWLNTVKVVLGFLELALALKFFSVVDLAYHWGIMKREIFLAIWIAIFAALGLYLLGAFKLSHDSDGKTKLSVGRLSMALFALSFALYMVPGLWGAPLRLLSGLAPPTNYREWNPTECPHGMDCYHDYAKGMQVACREEKPILIDFTGYACVNCRKMEDNVWSQKKVLKKLTEDYVVISLYVDDKDQLAVKEQVPSLRNGRLLKTIGDKWKDFQTFYYLANAQPQYILMDNEGKLLAAPRSYTPDVDEYDAFLQEGLCRYELRKKGN